MKNSNAVIIPYCLVLLQGVLYGFGDPISKAAYEVMPVYSLLTVRYLIATCFLMLFFAKPVLRGLKESSVREWMLPSVCIAAGYIAGNIALDLTAATTVAFLRSLLTVMTPILAFICYKKKYYWSHLPILVAVVIGMYLLCGMGGLGKFGAGEIWSLACAALEAGALVFGEKALQNTSPLSLTTVQCGMSCAMALICALLFEGGVQVHGDSAALTSGGMSMTMVWLTIVYLAILCTVAGYFLQNVAMKKISSSSVALLQCFCPVMTALFSRIILAEKLSVAGNIGAAIILICVIAESLIQNKQDSI